MAAGLCLNEDGGKLSRRAVSAGGKLQLYSGVTTTNPSHSWMSLLMLIIHSGTLV